MAPLPYTERSEYQIRTVEPGDGAAVASIYNLYSDKPSVQKALRMHITESKAKSDMVTILESYKAPYKVATHSGHGEVVAYAFVKPREGFGTTHKFAGVAELQIAVSPDHIGKGIGHSLVSAIVQEMGRSRFVATEHLDLTVEDQVAKSTSRWKTLLASMPALESTVDDHGNAVSDGLVFGPSTAEAQERVWTRLGFVKVGRLSSVIERNRQWTDELVWQMKL